MNCLHCGQAFDGKRADAKFCSVKCRVAYSRNTKPVTATRNADAVTDSRHCARCDRYICDDDSRNVNGQWFCPACSILARIGNIKLIPTRFCNFCEQRLEEDDLYTRNHVAICPQCLEHATQALTPGGPQMVPVTVPNALTDDERRRLEAHLSKYSQAALIQEIIAYRVDQDALRAQLYSLQAHMMKQYELIKITTDIGTPNESTLKIIAHK